MGRNKNGPVTVLYREPVSTAALFQRRIAQGEGEYATLMQTGNQFRAGCIAHVVAKYGEVPRGAAEGAGEGSGRTTTRWSGQRAVKPSEMQRRIDKALAKPEPEPEKPGITHPPGTVGLRRVCGSVSWRVRVAGSAGASPPPGCSGIAMAGA